MKQLFFWLLSMAIAVTTVAGIVLQATHPGLYNLAHFLAIFGALISIVVFPLMLIGFTLGQNETISKIMSNDGDRATCLKARPIGIFHRIFGIVWSIFFIALYASQGWYIVAFLFLVSFIFLQMAIPHWNQTIRKLHSLIELEKN